MCGGIRYTSDIADERTTIYPTLIEKAGIRVVIVSGEGGWSKPKILLGAYVVAKLTLPAHPTYLAFPPSLSICSRCVRTAH